MIMKKKVQYASEFVQLLYKILPHPEIFDPKVYPELKNEKWSAGKTLDAEN